MSSVRVYHQQKFVRTISLYSRTFATPRDTLSLLSTIIGMHAHVGPFGAVVATNDQCIRMNMTALINPLVRVQQLA
jgi:hypothetical protein